MQKIKFRDGFSILKTVGFREVGIAVQGLLWYRGEVQGDERLVNGKNVGFAIRRIWRLTWVSYFL